MKSKQHFKEITENGILITEEEYALWEKLQKQFEDFFKEAFKPKERDIVLWMSPTGFEFWEKLMKDEAEKYFKEYPETGEFSIFNPVEGDSRQIEDSLQEEDM